MTLLYAGPAEEEAQWLAAFRALDPGREIRVWPQIGDPAAIRWAVVCDRRDADLRDLPKLRALFSTWAGVEHILANPALPVDPPLVRMVEPGLTEGMRDYVVGHVMRRHLGMDAQQADQAARRWRPVSPPLARDRSVTVIGLGALGADCARALCNLGFRVTGWSRGAKSLAGIDCLSGADGFVEALARAEILVLLVPATDMTRRLIDAGALSRLPKGAHLINPARGALIDETALLRALDTGALASATLDVFAVEPLPENHPFWTHAKVVVTPHIASITRPPTAARAILDAIAAIERGETPAGLVDRARGY